MSVHGTTTGSYGVLYGIGKNLSAVARTIAVEPGLWAAAKTEFRLQAFDLTPQV